MRIAAFSTALALAAAAALPGSAQPAPKDAPKPAEARIGQAGTLTPAALADIQDPTGKVVGRAFFYEGPRGMLIRLEVGAQTPGWHGVHIHEKGVCTGPGFESAGSHLNPGKKTHGLLHASGAEAGDLPSFFVESNGVARTSMYSDLISAKGAGGRATLLDADGAAIVIHASPDDQSTQPTGNSGARVACGVIKAPVAPAS